ncbi:hypothetical protein [Labrys monachus]|uniref:Type II toxin-antitoxin system HicB family antitoxin n=1 Tax=Labrys monachus TaxID=217067 RepID=A0ABU0FDI4_9HYPH|nr:hypothetical protein [Labrys monachus]MDQ0392666.1 hypothetical protein [Labrys monachus]
MAKVTYYAVLPFIRNDEGDLVSGEAAEAPSAGAAKSRAAAAIGKYAGAIAFSRAGDPSLGDFEDAVVLARYGETPDDVALE